MMKFFVKEEREGVEWVGEDDEKGGDRRREREMFMVGEGGVLMDRGGMGGLEVWEWEEGLKESLRDIEEVGEKWGF